MTVTVAAPLPIAREEDAFGAVLGGGLVYTFQAGSDLPLATYQDLGGNVPNTNPVKLDASGRAIIRYLPQAYKIKVTGPDSAPGKGDGAPQWTLDNYWPPLSSEPLTAGAFLASVRYLPTDNEISGGITPTNYAYPPGHVARYGAVGDGATNDRAAILAAFAAGCRGDGPVVFAQGKSYYLGPSASGESIITLSAPSNLAVYGNHATLIANTAVFGAQPRVLNITDPQNLSIYDLNGYDRNANIAVDWQGAWLFFISTSGSTGQCGDILLSNCRAENMLGLVAFYGANGKRIRDISILSCTAKTCYYGISCQENGDALFADLRTWNVRRSYFPYGITGHTVNIDIYNDTDGLGAATCCLIKRYQRDTYNIKLRASFSGNIVHSALCRLEHQPQGSTGKFEDIQLEINVSNPADGHNNSVPVVLNSLISDGTEETSTLNVFKNIGIAGNFASQNQGAGSNVCVDIRVSPSTPADIWFGPSVTSLKANQAGRNNWIFRWSPVHESRFAYGDLTATTVHIPLPGWQAFGFTLKTRVWMHDAIANLGVQNVTYQESVITGYNTGADVVSIQQVSTTVVHSQGTAGTVTYTANGQNIDVTFGGAPYAVATANCRVDVEYVSLTHP